MEITIVTLDYPFQLEVSHETTVREIKDRISEEREMNSNLFDLIFEGNNLDLDTKIIAAGVTAGSEIELSPSTTGIATEKLIRLGIEPTPIVLLSEIEKNGPHVELLLQSGIDMNCRARGSTPLLTALRMGDKILIKRLLSLGADPNLEAIPLQQTVSLNNLETTEILLQKGADPNLKNQIGDTAIYSAITTEMLKLLMDYNADVNVRNNSGCTFLHRCVFDDYTNLISLFLDRVVNINETDLDRCTCLHYTVDSETVQTLIEAGADPRIQNWRGNTPLHCSVTDSDNNDVSRVLISDGRSLNIQNCDGDTPLHIICSVRNDSLYSDL